MEVRVLFWAPKQPLPEHRAGLFASVEQANPVRSELNRDIPLARPGEFQPLRLGARLVVDPPVVLAPMAGVTNAPYRLLCQELAAAADARAETAGAASGSSLYVSEMITARSFAMGHAKTLRLASFAPEEKVRSIQLYGTHPDALAAATKILVGEWDVHHIDLNFGCPVRKITANGGGSAIPVRPRLMARLVRAVVGNAGAVPVTVKFRKGIDADVLTFRDAGRVAQEEGCVAAALHPRTAADLYSGEADWSAIGELKAALSIPVLGNGDIFEAFDALRMMRETGCDGVVVGRACLGRPWLFRELADVFAGREPQEPPNLGEVVEIAKRHADLLVDFFGEYTAMQHMRKHSSWYTKSFTGMAQERPRLQRVRTRDELEGLLDRLPKDLPFPVDGLRVKRGKAGGRQKVSLPHGYLDDREDDRLPFEDPLDAGSGG